MGPFRALWLVLIILSGGGRVFGESPLVFVSSFAAGDQGAIHAYRLDEEAGRLTPVHRTGGVENPFFLAVSPDQRFLYAIHAKSFGGKDFEEVAAFSLVGRGGELKPLNRTSTRGTASCYLDVDATGKTLLVANYSTGSVASLPIREDGSLAEIATFAQHSGASVDKSRQEGPHAHCFVISPDNRFAYAADLGLDQVLAYRLNAASGTLEPARQPFARTPPGAGPRHLTFHPNGKWMYVINELSNSVTRYDYDQATGGLIERGTISTLPDDFTGTSYCADLKITPDGKFLYGTNRGHDSLACYRIDDGGELTRIAIEPSRGKGPQNLAIAAGGKLLLCANMPGHNVAVFRIDSESGRLTALEPLVEQPSPSCIRVLP